MREKKLQIAQIAMLCLIGAVATGCADGEDFSLLTSPTPVTTPTSPVPPASESTFTLNGRVTETPPTSLTGIRDAIVTITGGPNAGRSARTNDMGFYTIPDIALGTTIDIRADGYLASSAGVDVGRTAGMVQLMPVPATATHTLSDTLSSSVGACSDGVSQRPCHILTIPIHNNGPLEATLTWDPASAADLDLTLFRTGSPSPIARSASTGSAPERIKVDLTGGSTFELRVTYASGSGAPKYTLRATHQN